MEQRLSFVDYDWQTLDIQLLQTFPRRFMNIDKRGGLQTVLNSHEEASVEQLDAQELSCRPATSTDVLKHKQTCKHARSQVGAIDTSVLAKLNGQCEVAGATIAARIGNKKQPKA